jgi:hypothetical protein
MELAKLVNYFQRLQLTIAAQHAVCWITYIPATHHKKPPLRSIGQQNPASKGKAFAKT